MAVLIRHDQRAYLAGMALINTNFRICHIRTAEVAIHAAAQALLADGPARHARTVAESLLDVS